MSRVHDDENVRGIMFQIQYLTHQGAEIGGHFPNQTWSTFLHTYFYPQLQFLLNKHRSLLLCLSSPSLTLKKKKVWLSKRLQCCGDGREKMKEEWIRPRRWTVEYGLPTVVATFHLWCVSTDKYNSISCSKRVFESSSYLPKTTILLWAKCDNFVFSI